MYYDINWSSLSTLPKLTLSSQIITQVEGLYKVPFLVCFFLFYPHELKFIKKAISSVPKLTVYTVEPHYNEDLGTMEIGYPTFALVISQTTKSYSEGEWLWFLFRVGQGLRLGLGLGLRLTLAFITGAIVARANVVHSGNYLVISHLSLYKELSHNKTHFNFVGPSSLFFTVQWNLVITRSLGPWNLPRYIRFLIISG